LPSFGNFSDLKENLDVIVNENPSGSVETEDMDNLSELKPRGAETKAIEGFLCKLQDKRQGGSCQATHSGRILNCSDY
jgi:hypothetical protein